MLNSICLIEYLIWAKLKSRRREHLKWALVSKILTSRCGDVTQSKIAPPDAGKWIGDEENMIEQFQMIMTVRHWILLRENNGRDQNSKYAWPGWLFNEDKAFWIANYLVKRLKSLSAKDSHPMRGYQYRLLGTKLYRICYFCCFGCLEGHLRPSYSPVKSGLRNIRFLPKTSRMQIS